jgi:hypothetical protein
MEKKERRVISASRRTDLVGCYPEVMVERLSEFPREAVHSVVVWTKNPKNLILPGPLQECLRGYRQIFLHLTITGMGGGPFEPAIPRWEDVVPMIEPLVELTGDPRRISWRFDPILEVEGHGGSFSNLDRFGCLIKPIASMGVRDCRISWVSPYRKVVRRLEREGWRLVERSAEERMHQAATLSQIARPYSMQLHYCAQEGFPVSRCIDGEFLSARHPDALACSKRKAHGQRPLCGCSESLDIGWYSLACRNGCLYCYASP